MCCGDKQRLIECVCGVYVCVCVCVCVCERERERERVESKWISKNFARMKSKETQKFHDKFSTVHVILVQLGTSIYLMS